MIDIFIAFLDMDDHGTLLATTIIPTTEREELPHLLGEAGESPDTTMTNGNVTDAVVHHQMTVDGKEKGPQHYPDRVSDCEIALCSISFATVAITLGLLCSANNPM